MQAMIRALFLDMDAEIEALIRRWLNGEVDDAKHEALVGALEVAYSDKASAREGILSIVAQVASDHYWARRGRNRRFPAPEKWPIPQEAGTHRRRDRQPEDQLHKFPDTRPNPEEEAIRKEAEEAIAALGRKMGEDPTWRGELYRLLYVEGLSEGEAAVRLGITPEAAWQRAKRLRDYLRDSPEGARIRKGGRT